MKPTLIDNKWARAALWTTAGVIVSVGFTLAQSNKKFEVPTWVYATAAIVLCPVAYSKGCEWNQNYLFPWNDLSNLRNVHTVSEVMVIEKENKK